MTDKIKIVHILNSLCVGGIEKSIVELCNRLDPQKYEITLLVLSDNILELKDSVEEHVHCIFLPIIHHASSLRDTLSLLWHLNYMTDIFSRISPDIIHTHTFQYNVMPVLIAIRKAAKQSQHVHTIHTSGIHYEKKNIKQKIKLKIEDWWYKRCSTQLVCISFVVKEPIMNLGIEKIRPSVIIHNGIDINKFAGIEHRNLKECKLVYTARLDKGKSHDILLKAFAVLCHRYDHLELVLIGDGPLRENLEQLSRNLDIDKKVKFVGVSQDVAKILYCCHIGVFPSEFEGFGIALIEMMAVGLPIVCTDIPIFHSILGEDGNALFFPVRDSSLLAEQIEKFIINPQLRDCYAEKSVQRARQFLLDTTVEQYERLYCSFIVK